MARHAWGVHLPNGPMDLGRWIDLVGNGCYTLLHGEASACGEIRRRAPEALILVRCYLEDWTSWDPAAWARECARIYRGVKGYTRHITWANEQNLRAESRGKVGAGDGIPCTKFDYELIRDWNRRFLDEWAKQPDTADAILHYPAFATGHFDDWPRDESDIDHGFLGLEICRAEIDRCHVLDRHYYFNPNRPTDDVFYGVGRAVLTEKLFPGKPQFVSECGNFAVTDGRSPDQYVAAGYSMQARPSIVGFTWFIADSPDPGHAANNLSRNQSILDALTRTARTPNAYTDARLLELKGRTPVTPRDPFVGTGFRKALPYVGAFTEDEVYHFPGTDDEVSLAVGQLGYCTWSKKTNETVVVLANGSIYRDLGNRGDGNLRRVA